MLARNLAAVLLALGIVGIVSPGIAQDSTGRDRPILDRLNEFGKSIFGTQDASNTKDSAVQKPSDKAKSKDSDIQKPSEKAKPKDSATTKSERPALRQVPALPSQDDGSQPAALRLAHGTPKMDRRPLSGASLFDDGALPEISSPPKPALRPLHERLAAARKSVFGDDTTQEPRPPVIVEPSRPADAVTRVDALSSRVPETTAVSPHPGSGSRSVQEPGSWHTQTGRPTRLNTAGHAAIHPRTAHRSRLHHRAGYQLAGCQRADCCQFAGGRQGGEPGQRAVRPQGTALERRDDGTATDHGRQGVDLRSERS